MAKIEIDNKRMWETAIRLYRKITGQSVGFDKALEGMGLCYKDGEITTIEPKLEWYVALNDYGHYINTIGAVPLFLKGERTTKENVFNMCKDIMGYEITEEEFNKNFRPATEEEIPQTNSTKPYNPLKKQRVATNHIESKPEPKERKVSGVLKKMLDNLDEESLAKTREEMLEETELTDFEKVLAECIHRAQGSVLSPEGVAITWSDALMAEARKLIASEIDTKSMCQIYLDKHIDTYSMWCYREGLEDAIKKIKGESV